MRMPIPPETLRCPAGAPRTGPIRFGAGFGLRRALVLAGWLLLPLLLALGWRGHSPLHFLSAILLAAALWPVTTRSGEVLWESTGVSVRRYFRFVPLEGDRVEAAVVTPPLFRRQSLVLRLRRRLLLSRYVYCRLAPESVCDAWALVHEHDWEPRG
jgi:hypothetical protein